jgi:hypothetical protein
MPKLQQHNDSELLKTSEYTYIYCIKRSCRPRINIFVCDQCCYNRKCAEYQCFKQGITEEEFRESIRPKKRKRKTRKKKK